MGRKSVYRYYMFGFNYHILLRSGAFTNQRLLSALDDYYGFLEELDLPVTLSGVSLKSLAQEHDELRKAAGDATTSKEKADKDLLGRIQKKLNEIDNILDAELGNKVAYVPSEKRYPLRLLLDDCGKLLAEGVYDSLPKVAKYDFTECCTCLALDRYTASAFHVLRGTEDVLKLYCAKLLNKAPSDRETWGTYLKVITSAVKGGNLKPEPPEELMLNLESLRKYYRNRTQHPTMIYSSDEAQDLVSLCIKSVNEIVKDLKKRKLVP